MIAFINQAYLDPSATTAIISAIAGVAVAVGAFVVVGVRKAKKKVSDKLGIEERNKAQDEDDIEFTDDTK